VRHALRTTLLAAGAAILMAAPAQAADGCVSPYTPDTADGFAHWYDASDGIPENVDLLDVAAAGSGTSLRLVAVGMETDPDTQATAAVVYRLTASGWVGDEIADLAPGDSKLDQVALTDGGGWAIGEQQGAAAPLVLRLGAGGWTEVTPPADFGKPTAIGSFGPGGYVGDDGGTIWRFTDSDATLTNVGGAASAGKINGISLFANGTGFAGADSASATDPSARFFKLQMAAGTALTPAPDVAMAPDQPGTDIEAVAATQSLSAAAIDSRQRVWHIESGRWVQEPAPAAADPIFPANTDLVDIAAVVDATTASFVDEAIAGTIDDSGAAWWRRRQAGSTVAWECVTFGPEQIRSVAVVNRENIWAVGDGGVVMRRWAHPIPDEDGDGVADYDDQCPDDPQGVHGRDGCPDSDGDGVLDKADACPEEHQGSAGRGGCPDSDGDGVLDRDDACPLEPAEEGGSDGCPPVEQNSTGADRAVTAESEPAEQPPPAPRESEPRQRPPAEPTAERGELPEIEPVVEPVKKKKGTGKRKHRKRLLKGLKVKSKGRAALRISFRLTARARVSIYATRDGRVVGTTGTRTLRRGKRKLVLRFRGRPPSNLKVTARRMRKGDRANDRRSRARKRSRAQNSNRTRRESR